MIPLEEFQSPRSGQICSNSSFQRAGRVGIRPFQSPRSGQICSNKEIVTGCFQRRKSFNPLDRVKFVQIVHTRHSKPTRRGERFNPLDRVKFVQIKVWLRTI